MCKCNIYFNKNTVYPEAKSSCDFHRCYHLINFCNASFYFFPLKNAVRWKDLRLTVMTDTNVASKQIK